jgi:Lhr-like helicase
MNNDQKDVLIAAYLYEDLAKQDFDAVLKLAEDKAITVEGGRPRPERRGGRGQREGDG